MAVFVSDTFTDADATLLTAHTGEAGAVWTLHTGNGNRLTTSGNRLACASTGYEVVMAYASGAPAGAEYDVEAVFRYAGALPLDAYDGVCGRFVAADGDHYRVVYETFSSNLRWKLLKRSGGTDTSLGTYSQTLAADTDYAVKLEIRDAAKKVYVGGVERISSTDNAEAAAGGVAVYAFSSGDGTRLDTLAATDAGGSPPAGTLLVHPGVAGGMRDLAGGMRA